MCTSLSLNNKYFGRNLDLEYTFGEQIIITPRSYRLDFKMQPTTKHHLALIGIGTIAEDYPLYAEAINEKGLYMAGLYFPDNAFYHQTAPPNSLGIAPYELIPFVLSQCQDLKAAKQLLQKICLVDMPFNQKLPLAPLHWHIADQSGALVFEQTQAQSQIYDDPVGVLTNNPPLPFHLNNLHSYQNLSAKPPQNTFSPELKLKSYGQGMGAIGLPGDWSPMSRYVRAAFLKSNSVCSDAEDDAVSEFFHILDSVAMVRGSVITPDGKNDITNYSCCINAERGIYYYKTYTNNQISAVHLFNEDLNQATLISYPMVTQQNIKQIN